MPVVSHILSFFTTAPVRFFLKLGLALLLALALYFLKTPFARNFIKLVNRTYKKNRPDRKDLLSPTVIKPLAWFIFFLTYRIALSFVPFNWNPPLYAVVQKLFNSALILTSLHILYVFLQDFFMAKVMVEDAKFDSHKTAWSYIKTLLSTLIILVAILLIMNEWIDNLNGLLAGLGVTGLIVALAAQDTASNLVAGIAIMLDKPFEIGDWIVTETGNGELSGTVVSIGLRSCRVRTVDDSFVTVPNNILGAAMIINGTKRSSRMVKLMLPLATEDTTEENLKDFRDRLIQLLEEDPDVASDGIMVHFVDYARNAVIWQVRFKTTEDYGRHMDIRHKVNLKIYGLMEEMKLNLASGAVKVNA